jgi:hypothetical protein
MSGLLVISVLAKTWFIEGVIRISFHTNDLKRDRFYIQVYYGLLIAAMLKELHKSE